MAVANSVNPRKKFSWSVEFDGLEPILVQKVKLPVLSVDVHEHGQANMLIKTGGMVKVGDVELTKMLFQNKSERWAYEWMRQVSNLENGQVGLPNDYKKNGFIIWYGTDGTTVLQKWQVVGCWPKNIDLDELDKLSSDNVMEKITLSCDQIIPS